MTESATNLSVKELLALNLPGVANMLENSGGFWYRIKDNSIPNSELLRLISSDLDYQSETFRNYLEFDDPQDLGMLHVSNTLFAGLLVLQWRKDGTIPTPQEPIESSKS
jgi:hypothetical protein